MTDTYKEYGPLAYLVGKWQGSKGQDVAPSPERGTEKNKFREEMLFEPIGLVDNHEQLLYGLRYKTMAWEEGEEEPFHEEVGYYLWDAANKQIMRCFIVPRGISVIAGATVEADAKTFKLAADIGSETYGICSNKFLDEEFKTVRFDCKLTQVDENTFSYFEDTQLKMKGREDLFHHTDENTMTRS